MTRSFSLRWRPARRNFQHATVSERPSQSDDSPDFVLRFAGEAHMPAEVQLPARCGPPKPVSGKVRGLSP